MNFLIALYIISTILAIGVFIRTLFKEPFVIIQMYWFGYLMPITPIVNTLIVVEVI